MSDRLQALKELVTENPSDVFARYGLAMAYAGAGEFERALEQFEAVLALNPDYTVTYFQAGQALKRLGRLEEARQMYQRGIEVTTRLRQEHARSQLQSALDMLG